MLRDETLYIEAEVKTISTAQNVKDEIARSVFIEAEPFTDTAAKNTQRESEDSAYNINITDFALFVNAAQPQRAINRQLEYWQH